MRTFSLARTAPWSLDSRRTRFDRGLSVLVLSVYSLLWLTPNLYLVHLKPDIANFGKMVIAGTLLAVWHLGFRSLGTAVFWALPFFLLWPLDLHYSLHYLQPPTTVLVTTLVQTTAEETLDYLRGRETELLGLFACALLAWSSALRVGRALVGSPAPWLRRSCQALFIALVGSGIAMYAPLLAARLGNQPVLPATTPLLSLKGVFPFGRLVSLAEYGRERIGIDLMLRRRQSFRFGATQPAALADQPQHYVLVIGETGRPDRWSLNGYRRDTTPRLRQIEGVHFLRDLITPVTTTAYAVPVLVSRIPGTATSQLFDEPSILSAFKEAGFRTYWISMQPSFGKTESLISQLAYEADETRFLSASNNAEIGVTPPDTVAVEQLATLLQRPEPRQFFVIHTMGSHDAYHKRYPREFDVFQPSLSTLVRPDHHDPRLKTEVNNAYDNSVLFTDTVLASVIERLQQRGSLAGIFYAADHGENLFDDTCPESGHGGRHQWEYPVPALVWTSPAHRSRWPDKAAALRTNQSRPATTGQAFATTLDLAGITLQGRVPSGSLLDPTYTPGLREVQADDQLLDWDSGVFEGACRALVTDRRTLAASAH